MVRIVGGDHRGVALLRQTADHSQHPQLVAEVQVGGGLVKEHHLGVADDGPGHGGLLPLAAADIRVGPVGQMGKAHGLQGLLRLPPVLRPRPGQGGKEGRPAHKYKLQHGVVKDRGVVLGHIARQPGDLPLAHGGNVPPAQADGPRPGGQQAHHAVEEGAFARAVGAQHRQNLPLLQGETHLLQHRWPAGVGKIQIMDFIEHGPPSFAATAASRRRGPPPVR